MLSNQDEIVQHELISRIDWAQAWKNTHQKSPQREGSKYWDGRALSFGGSRSDSSYINRFIELMDIKAEESVLDVGCGNGMLALPLAEAGHAVTAVDFSPKMLEMLETEARKRNLTNIHIVEASWEDDWLSKGIESTDVAIASRSLGVNDLASALSKLEQVARRRVCVTIPTEHSPRYSKILWDAVGRETPSFHEHIYCMNILFQKRITPELRVISSIKHDRFVSRNEGCERIASALGEMSEEEKQRFETFCADHLIQEKDDDGQEYWTRDYPRKTNWAFISWNTKEKQ